MKRNSDYQDFQPQKDVLTKIIIDDDFKDTCRLSLSERPIQRSAWSEPEKEERCQTNNLRINWNSLEKMKRGWDHMMRGNFALENNTFDKKSILKKCAALFLT